jgi:hypothetical protein
MQLGERNSLYSVHGFSVLVRELRDGVQSPLLSILTMGFVEPLLKLLSGRTGRGSNMTTGRWDSGI